MEEAPGFEPGVWVLQTHALPLGDASEIENADYIKKKRFLKALIWVKNAFWAFIQPFSEGEETEEKKPH